MGAPAAGVGKEGGKTARRATVFVGVTCGDARPVPVWMPWMGGGELVELAPL
jgi:hypothetical protein